METNNDKRLGLVKSCLSSLLVMSKTGYTLVGLEEDYMEMVGTRLTDDIRPLGFKSVAEFLLHIPDVARRDACGWGADVYRAVADASTRHIKDLVDKTPASKSRGRKARGKPKQWPRAQIRSYSPPARHSRWGHSYGMRDDNVCGYEDNFFDDGDEMFSEEVMSNYRKEYAPVMVKAGIGSQMSKEFQHTRNEGPKEEVKHQLPYDTVNNNDVKLSQNNAATTPEHNNVTSNTRVAGPVIPPVGSYLDVAVTMAVSPDKFTVQPCMESPKLKAHMADMKAFYEVTNSQPEDHGECKVGDYFAAPNMAGEWHRMMVTKIINSYKVAVKYIDFGYQSITDKSKLRLLHPKFEHLPIQATIAKLDGAHSNKHQVWSLDDKVWFNRRVVGGQFVSIVKDVEQASDGVVFTLELIDTSNPLEDVYIVHQLLERI